MSEPKMGHVEFVPSAWDEPIAGYEREESRLKTRQTVEISYSAEARLMHYRCAVIAADHNKEMRYEDIEDTAHSVLAAETPAGK